MTESAPRLPRTAPSIVHEVLRSPGHPLDDEVLPAMNARFGTDFSQVRVHTDARAAASARAVHADAYAVGQDIVFGSGRYAPGTSGGQELVAHELAHTVQQRGAGPRVPGSLELSDRHSGTEAEAAAGAVPRGTAGLHVARQESAGPDRAADQARRDRAGRLAEIRAALARPGPVAGVGDFAAAFDVLNGVNADDQVWLSRQLSPTGELATLLAHESEAGAVNRPRLRAVMRTVLLLDNPAGSVGQAEADSVGADIETLTGPERSDLLTAVARARVPGTAGAMTLEGLAAMMTAAGGANLNPGLVGVGGDVGPGPWAPPGNQPIPFYLGTAAHLAIAAAYRSAHPGERVETNTVSIESILRMLSEPPLNVPSKTKGMRRERLDSAPDITNLTARHLYEIKPKGSEQLARTEANWYVASFTMAGVPMSLGPTAAAGVTGAVPAPGGVYLFECVSPGVIVYQLRRARVVEVPVTSTAGERRRQFQLQPLTAQQVAAVGTVAVAAAILMFLAEYGWVALL